MKSDVIRNADVIVIGAGPGGYVAALKLAMKGKKVFLIEQDRVGGTCLNRGCIPTKALIHCAETLDTVKNSGHIGISVDSFNIDMEKVDEYKNSVVRKLVGGVSYLLNKRGVETIFGTAEFEGEKKIAVTMADGTKQHFSAKSIVIASGTESALPPIPGIEGDHIITSTQALDVSVLPESLAVIGGGVIGMEIGSVYAAFGVKVTVLEALPKILPAIDSDVTAEFEKTAGTRMKIETGAKVKEITDWKGGKKIIYEFGDETRETIAQKVLICVGRRPNTKGLRLDQAGVKVSERGYILTNDQYETNVPGIYAIGDVNGRVLLAHAASAQAALVAEKISGGESGINTRLIPGCIYTRPEIAYVGKTQDELEKEHIPYNVGKFPLSANGKALSMDEPEGFVKLLTGKKYGEILGAHIVGTRATDLIGELALAMNSECTAEEIINTVHAHPTVSEAIAEAAEMAYLGEAVHIL